MIEYEGDPKLVMTENGSKLVYSGGQPIMDRGFENQSQIALFTQPGWAGNVFADNDQEKIGSDFVEVANGPITATSLNTTRQSGIDALKSDLFGDVDGEISNFSGSNLDCKFTVRPPNRNSEEILARRNGVNWINQKDDPVNQKLDVKDPVINNAVFSDDNNAVFSDGSNKIFS